MPAPVLYGSGSIAATTYTVLFDGPVELSELQLTDTSAAINTVTLRDNDSASVSTRALPLWYGRTVANATITPAAYVDVFGRTITPPTYPGQTSVALTHALNATAASRIGYVVTIPASTTIFLDFSNGPLGFTYGLQAYAAGTCTYNMGYKNLAP